MEWKLDTLLSLVPRESDRDDFDGSAVVIRRPFWREHRRTSARRSSTRQWPASRTIFGRCVTHYRRGLTWSRC